MKRMKKRAFSQIIESKDRIFRLKNLKKGFTHF